MQNLKMSPAMISRFDLVFLLLDRPDAERDQRLTEHVMAVHSGLTARAQAARAGLLEYRDETTLLITQGDGNKPALKERLRQRKPDDEPVPHQLLRKYIAYARQYIHPVVTPSAATVIKSFYLNLREQSAADPTAPPVTHRQLESLIRLAEARARVDLREQVSEEDAEEAVEIMKESLAGLICEGPSMLDFGVNDSGRGNGRGGGKGFQAERRRLIDSIHRYCEFKGDKELEIHELYSIADKIELAVPDTGGFIEQLNESGDLLKRGGSRYAYNGTIRNSSSPQQRQNNSHSAPPSHRQQHQYRGAVAGKRGPPDEVPGGWNGGNDDRFDW